MRRIVWVLILLVARRHLDHPAERLLVRSLRVVEVAPAEGERCRWAVRVRAYSVFWIYRTVVVRCDEAAG